MGKKTISHSDIDTSKWDPNNTDKAKIDSELWVPCRICEAAFRRLRLTARYCIKCEMGFCEGEHGTFAGNIARCIMDGPHPRK